MARDLDNVDRGILYMLQRDARNTTSGDIADKTGVSASTIRNRIDQLEDDGIIKGYHPDIDYESANLPLHLMFVITAPPKQRDEVVEQLLNVQGVVDVREMITGRRNIRAEVVGRDTRDVVRITDAIHDLGVEVDSSEVMKQRRVQPFNHFYFSEAAEEMNEQDGDDEDE